MAFNPNDIYTSSGSVVLFNSWTPYVSKFDTSTFYNWEQDNVPLYDLEERTYELWEQTGFATSAGVPGLALSVSADAPSLTLQQNPNIFVDVSSAIAAIPKVVRFPVLVEVANFGDLGALELHNFRIEEEGSIEIINRNFARTYNASSDVRSVVVPSNGKYSQVPSQISSLDLANTLRDTSCVHIATPVLSSTNDPRLTKISSSFYPSISYRATPLAFSIQDSNWSTGTPSEYGINVYENVSTDQSIETSDVSSFNTQSGGLLRRPPVSVSDNLGGNFYGNFCTKISVKNCDGPIYIRNFFVDGETVRPVGIEVNNSKVFLENCSAARAQEAGFQFVNSNILLSRSAFSYRNYKKATSTTREPEFGVGFEIINSEVEVSSLPVSVGSTSVGDNGAEGQDVTVIASRNTKGFVVQNSTLKGGYQRTTSNSVTTGGVISSELNTSAGMVLKNAFVDVKGLLDIFGNNIGIESDNSYFKYENLTVDGNQTQGVKSIKSSFIVDSESILDSTNRKQLDFSGNATHLDLEGDSTFAFELKDSVPSSYGNSFFRSAFAGGAAVYAGNNSNADLIKPYIDVTQNSPIGTSYGRALKATNGSVITLNGCLNGATFIIGPADYGTQRTTAGVCADKNSVVNFHGPTAIAQFGVDVLAKDNSVMNFEPRRIKGSYYPDIDSFDLSSPRNHTTVELHSTRSCLVAQRNSTINMRDLGAFPANWGSTASGVAALDVASYTLDNSSVVSGGSLQFFANPQDSQVITTDSLNTIPSYTVPLIPEQRGTTNVLLVKDSGYTAPDYGVRSGVSKGGVCVRVVENSTVNANNVHFPVPVNASPADGLYYDASGSECDQFFIWNVADTSRLNASYVALSGMHPISCTQHGPSALWASSDGGTSEVIASGAPIGTPDTGSLSILDAFGAGSGVWTVPSGVDINSNFNRFYPLSGNVPQEISEALSQAGINVSGGATYTFGFEGAFVNRGFFRLYWSPKSSARLLQSDLSGYTKGSFPHDGNFSGVVGPAYQLFAQGYNCSAPLSALVPLGEFNASSIAPDLLKLSYDSDGDGVYDTLWTSGFYYCGEILDEDPTQCILDESAADMFANARNASVGLAGRPRKTTIYSDTTDRNSEGYPGDGIGGFKSASIFDLSRDN